MPEGITDKGLAGYMDSQIDFLEKTNDRLEPIALRHLLSERLVDMRMALRNFDQDEYEAAGNDNMASYKWDSKSREWNFIPVDKLGNDITEGSMVDVQKAGIFPVYKKDGELWFEPYGNPDRVMAYFSNDLIVEV